MNTLVSVAALAMGLMIAVAPAQAARIWSAGRLESLPPRRRKWFLRAYRTLGVTLSLSGILYALEGFRVF